MSTGSTHSIIYQVGLSFFCFFRPKFKNILASQNQNQTFPLPVELWRLPINFILEANKRGGKVDFKKKLLSTSSLKVGTCVVCLKSRRHIEPWRHSSRNELFIERCSMNVIRMPCQCRLVEKSKKKKKETNLLYQLYWMEKEILKSLLQ